MIKMMLLLAITTSRSTLPQALSETSAPEAALVLVKSNNSTSGKHGRTSGRRELYDSTEEGQRCLPSPLWENNVDPAKYEFGCTEIEVILSSAQSRFLRYGNHRVTIVKRGY